MSQAQRRFVQGQTISAMILNGLINGFLAWHLLGDATALRVWGGPPSVSGDLVVTSFVLPVALSLIMTPLVRRAVVAGKAPALDWTPRTHWILRVLPRAGLARAIVLGLITVAVVAPAFIVALNAFAPTVTGGQFAVVKGAYTAVLSVPLSWAICAWAMSAAAPST